MGTFLLVGMEPLAVVAADAFALDDLRPLNRAPLARLLADTAGLAFRPAFVPKNVRFGKPAERAANGAQNRAIRMAPETVRPRHQADHLQNHRRAEVRSDI